MHVLSSLLEYLVPNRCIHCRRIIHSEEVVCELCFSKISFTHDSFGKLNATHERCSLLFPVENTFALMNFEDGEVSQQIIHQLKYKNRERIGEIVGNWTLERLSIENKNIDLIVSVPLHVSKWKKRGYNQLHLFGNTLSKGLNVPIDHEVLQRNYANKPQALQDKEHRTQNKNLFSLRKTIEYKHILLIDDVLTTGNTLASVAWELLKNEKNTISIVVMAID